MKKLSLIFWILILPLFAICQQETYSRVRIHLDSQELSALKRTGIEFTGFNRQDRTVISELSASELKHIAGAGFRYDVLINDMQRYYVERNQNQSPALKTTKSAMDFDSEWPVPANFTLGSCGGFLTLDDMIAQLDQMRSLYPDLITVKQSLSDTITTIEGRPIYFVKISDNPDIAENEPQVLYTGMHHAREPIGMQHLMFYMWYLLENYATNPDIKNVVDNTEMYFIPVINPDGYQYNIDHNPNGGGMWRKNRRNSGGGNFGIDINRNYGYMWGYDDEGSSPDPYSELYRGTAPFSEPETRMVKYFCESHDFKIALNYHSYSDLFLYTWGWSPDLTPDDSLMNTQASAMTLENDFTYGPGYATIYATNGGSDDWMYGEQTTKEKIFSYTPEIGSNNDGFWPMEDNIIPLCQESMLASLLAAKLVNQYGFISETDPLFIYQDNGYLHFNVKRMGLQPCDFTASIVPLGTSFASVGTSVNINSLDLFENKQDSIAYQLAPVNHVGDTISYVLVLNNGMYTVTDTVRRIFGYPYTVFSDKFDDKSNWTGTWNLTTNSCFSPLRSMTDSPTGNYLGGANKSISMLNAITVNPALLSVLEFRAHWALENDYDYVQLKISANNGSTWTPMTGKYTNAGSSSQLYGQPLYDGSQGEWVHESILLNSWAGKDIKLRFTMVSDGGTETDGYYFDDLSVSYVLDPTSIGDPESSLSILGFPSPNPAEHLFRISYLLPAGKENAVLKAYSASGLEKADIGIDQNKGNLGVNVDGWPAGIYYLRLEVNGESCQVRKLVVL